MATSYVQKIHDLLNPNSSNRQEHINFFNKIKLKTPESSYSENEKSPTREIDPSETHAMYKASAVLRGLDPILQEAFRKKNPEKYNSLMNALAEKAAEANKMFDVYTGKYKGYYTDPNRKMTTQEWKDYFTNYKNDRAKLVESFNMEESLSPGEIQKILGPERYKDYVSAIRVNRLGFEKEGVGTKMIGNIEKPLGYEDIRYGKRMATQPSVTGLSVSGPDSYDIYYGYNPNTGEIFIDPQMSKNVDLKTGVPIKKM